MKPVKKSLLVIASACLLIVGVTWALMSKVTETATNTFSSNRSISLKLREDKWDGFGFNDEYTQAPGSVAKNPNDANLGVNMAKEYYPGDKIPKNPTVMNTSNGENEYVAIKVIYEDNNGNRIRKNEFEKKYGKFQYLTSTGDFKDGLNPDFYCIEEKDDYSLYVYVKELNFNEKTPAIFDQFIIKKDIMPVGNTLPNFNIKVKAYAVQSENLRLNVKQTDNEVITALKELANEN